MRAHTQPLSKTGVTGVTCVTPFAKRPVLLAFTPVTHLSGFAHIRCNSTLACNAKVSALLLADALPPCVQSDFRWLRLPNSGRGIERYTLGDLGDD